MRALPTAALPLVALALAATGPIGAQEIGPGLNREVVSRADPDQRYAVFVPSAYRRDERWPLVLLMDPRGRALVPLERMQDAAERLGYIVLSSYETRSDGSNEPNEKAVAAMIDDAQDLFSIDTRRLYFAGFSGTARAAWSFAERFGPYTAGVIGLGAGLASPAQLTVLDVGGPIRLSFFGGAGDLDFNYEEVRTLDGALDDYHVSHMIDFYPGPHAWPDSDVFAHALEWLDVQAVRAGWQERDGAELEELYEGALARASRAEADGDVEAAWRLYRSAAADFEGLVDVSAAREGLGRVEAGRDLEDVRRRLRTEIDERARFDDEVEAWLQEVRSSGRPGDVEAARRRLDLAKLQREAADADDPAAAKAAARMLNGVFVLASFYVPAEFMDRGDFNVAKAFYRLADEIQPGSPGVCLGLARAAAQSGDEDEAFAALACAEEAGVLGSEYVRADPLLAPLRGDARFEALLRRIGGGS